MIVYYELGKENVMFGYIYVIYWNVFSVLIYVTVFDDTKLNTNKKIFTIYNLKQVVTDIL